MELHMDDLKIYYEIIGEGCPVIMLHGFGIDHACMKGCMEPVLEGREGYKRIYLDLPGMGKTKGGEWADSSDRILEVVLRFIECVIPGEEFILAGESYGGYLARGVVSRKIDYVKGLLLICPVIIADREKRTLPPHVTLASDSGFIAGLDAEEMEKAKQYEPESVVFNQRIWERVNREVLQVLELADKPRLSSIRKQYSFAFDVDAQPEKLQKPVLILTGKQDSVVGYYDALKILDNYPRGTFALLDRAGHNLQIEQEMVFNTLVNEWLDRVEEADKL